MKVNGPLIIDRTNQEFINKEVRMGPGAAIVINDGMHLRTENCDYLPCNNIMYRGIIVRGTIWASGNNIYDAHEGMYFFEFGRPIELSNNLFERNYIGITFNSDIAPVIHGNRFFCNGTYLSSYTGQPTKLGPANSTWLGLLGFGMTGSVRSNLFDGIGTGLRFVGGAPSITDNIFIDHIYTQSSISGFAMNLLNNASPLFSVNSVKFCHGAIHAVRSDILSESNYIDSCTFGYQLVSGTNRRLNIKNDHKIVFDSFGIHVDVTGGLSQLLIKDNRFRQFTQSRGSGIFLKGSGSRTSAVGSILDNNNEFRISLSARGIEVNNYQNLQIISNHNTYQSGNSTCDTGIYLIRTNGSNISRNVVQGYGASNGTGIYVRISPNSQYCCNEVPNNNIGINFDGRCTNSRIRNNKMDQNVIGLKCQPTETWLGFQGIGSSNRWPDSSATFEAQHLGSDNDMTRSRFDVTQRPSEFFPQPPPHNNWFRPLSGQNKSCIINCPLIVQQDPDTIQDDKTRFFGGDDAMINEVDEYVADHSSEWTHSNELGIMWNDRSELLNKLDLVPELLGQSDIVDSFYTAHSSSSLRAYTQLRHDLHLAGTPSSEQLAVLKQLYTDLGLLRFQIDSIDLELQESGVDTAALQAAKILIEEDILDIKNSILNTIESLRIATLNSLIIDIQSISASGSTQTEEKSVLLHLASYLRYGESYLSTSVLNNLLTIADQCLYYNLYSRYYARYLYNIIYPNHIFNDTGLCSSQQSVITSTKTVQQQDYYIFPNPSSGLINVVSKNSDISKLRLADLRGRELNSSRFRTGLKTAELTAVDLADGLYLITITNSSGIETVYKIVIKK